MNLFFPPARLHYHVDLGLPWGGAVLFSLTIALLAFAPQTPVVGYREIMAAFFVWTGMWYKQSGLVLEKNKWFLSVSSFLVILGSFFWRANMENCQWFLAAPYMITAVCGTLVVLGLSKNIHKGKSIVRFFLTLTGENTLKILTWHFLGFKIVSLLLIYVYDLSFTNLALFPVIGHLSIEGWWIIYTIIGVVFPLIIAYLLNKYKDCLIKI